MTSPNVASVSETAIALMEKSRRREVVGQRGDLHLGQRARRRVPLGPRRREVDVADDGRAERAVHDQPLAGDLGQPAGDLDGVTVDHQVHVDVRRPQQEVADGAADEVDRRVLRRQGQRPPQARHLGVTLEVGGERDHTRATTSISMRMPPGSAAAWTVVRAGWGAGIRSL